LHQLHIVLQAFGRFPQSGAAFALNRCQHNLKKERRRKRCSFVCSLEFKATKGKQVNRNTTTTRGRIEERSKEQKNNENQNEGDPLSRNERKSKDKRRRS